MNPLPMQDLTNGLRRNGLVRFLEQYEKAYPDLHLKDLAVQAIDDDRGMWVDGRRVVVVGIGVNVGWAPPDTAMLGVGLDPMALLAEMLRAYDRLPTDVWPLYRERLATLGAAVRVELPTETIEGRALDVERDGRLVVLDACGITHRFDVGDVVHLRAG